MPFLKAIAHSWAESKLKKETAYTQSLIRELDHAKTEANKRVEAKRNDYSHKIKAHQEKRNKELKIYIDFMNDQLKITGTYLQELNNFQNFTFVCADSWMHVDLCQQEIDIISKKLDAIYSTIGLLDAYIFELDKQSQRQGRYAWREFTATRELPIVNDFVDNTKRRIEREFKNRNDEFKNESKRLQSHRTALHNEANALLVERNTLFENKKTIDEKHNNNKNALADKYYACVEFWNRIAKAFEDWYAYKPSENHYANDWLRELRDGGTLPEIREFIKVHIESMKCANEDFRRLDDEYQPYKSRVKEARETQNYPDTFAYDNAEKKRLSPQVTEAYELAQAGKIFITRLNEMQGYIDRIFPLHPDEVMSSLCEMLNTDREFDNWSAFDYRTKKQRREYREKKQKRI